MKRTISKNRTNALSPFVIGVTVCIILVMIGSMLISYLKLEKEFSEQGEKWSTMLLIILSVMVGGVITIKMSNKRSIMTCLVFTAMFVVMQMIISMLIFDGISATMWGRGVIALLGAVGSFAICSEKEKKRPFTKMRSG